MSQEQNKKAGDQKGSIVQQNQSVLMELLLGIHKEYYTSIAFHEIDFIIGEPLPGMLDDAKSQPFLDYVCIIDGCLLFRQKSFYSLYELLLKSVQEEKRQLSVRHKCAEILLSMNGQNDKGYNLKKLEIQRIRLNFAISTVEEKQKNIKYLKHELSLNQAIIMKFKKTSSSYEYRFRLFSTLLLYTNTTFPEFQSILTQQHQLNVRILARFPRNYFCWMYRIRIFKELYTLLPDPEILKYEIKQIQAFLDSHPNDYSILSYYRFLLRQINLGEIQLLGVVMKNVSKLLQFCRIGFQQQNQYINLIKFDEELKKMNENKESKKTCE